MMETATRQNVFPEPKNPMRPMHPGWRIALCALLATASGASAQTYEQVAPREVPAGPAPTVHGVPERDDSAGQDERQIVPALRGLVFLSDRSAIQPEGVDVSGIDLSSTPLLDTEAFRASVRARIGQPMTFGDLREITREAIRVLREHDRPVTDVVVPEQNVQSGTIQILVIEGRLGTVRAEGQRWFDEETITGAVRMDPGEVISGSELLADLAWVNRNPFRRVDLVFAPGESAGEADIILRTTDRRPWRLYAGYEDTGTSITGDDRWLAGFNWGNAFGLDHQLNYQFTGSSDFEKMTAHSGSYIVPLPWRHTLSLFGSYAESVPEGMDPFDLEGETWQLSARYQLPLRPLGNIAQSLSAGLDFKRSDNNLAFGGTDVFGQSTDVIQAVLAYSANRPDAHGSTGAEVSLIVSPGGIGSRNSDSDYAAARSGASSRYAYLRVALDRTTRLPADLRWITRLQGQFASTNLLGSEQLGFGGSTSLRGYEEREVNGDNGFILVNELRTPPVSLGRHLGFPQLNDQFTFLAFVDGGIAETRKPLPGDERRRELMSAGIGFRFNVATHITARFDYGWQLQDSGVSPTGDSSRAHLGLTVAY